LPKDIDIETAKSTYNNGILEVTFDKKKQTRPKGKEIKIDQVLFNIKIDLIL
jgi:HSP20 family protein